MIGVTVCLLSGQNIRMYFEDDKGFKFCERLEKVYKTNDSLRIHEPGGAPIYFIPGKSIAAWYCHNEEQKPLVERIPAP